MRVAANLEVQLFSFQSFSFSQSECQMFRHATRFLSLFSPQM